MKSISIKKFECVDASNKSASGKWKAVDKNKTLNGKKVCALYLKDGSSTGVGSYVKKGYVEKKALKTDGLAEIVLNERYTPLFEKEKIHAKVAYKKIKNGKTSGAGNQGKRVRIPTPVAPEKKKRPEK